jgi:uncharacterized membrane-anchored protein
MVKTKANIIDNGNQMMKVPQVNAFFWIITFLLAGAGETLWDFLCGTSNPAMSMGIAFLVFIASIIIQAAVKKYIAWVY